MDFGQTLRQARGHDCDVSVRRTLGGGGPGGGGGNGPDEHARHDEGNAASPAG
jgi:hypothetical protein